MKISTWCWSWDGCSGGGWDGSTGWDVEEGESTGVTVGSGGVLGDDGALLKGTAVAHTVAVPEFKRQDFIKSILITFNFPL